MNEKIKYSQNEFTVAHLPTKANSESNLKGNSSIDKTFALLQMISFKLYISMYVTI